VGYFINKFTAIPGDQWCVHQLVNYRNQKCALGHCDWTMWTKTNEGKSLVELFDLFNLSVYDVNDGVNMYRTWIAEKNLPYLNHPKQRILQVLNQIHKYLSEHPVETNAD
jgi:hypothetical protein